jgi:alkanesulfonate monooxygenase SsuD/methylene tetrahydromethanopterin reductase-like flavin-dependent oxidoreductase (luciferase family)
VTASIDQLSGGRLTLGLAVGSRPDDFELAGRPYAGRGAHFDADLELLHQAWAGEPVAGSPFPVGAAHHPGPGAADRRAAGLAAPRAIRWDAGFTLGGAPPERAAGAIQQFTAAWERGGKDRPPRIAVLAYFSLGEEHTQESLHNLRTYYGFLDDWAKGIAGGAPRTPEAVRALAAAFEQLGVDELVFDPTVADLDQVDRLADAVQQG